MVCNGRSGVSRGCKMFLRRQHSIPWGTSKRYRPSSIHARENPVEARGFHLSAVDPPLSMTASADSFQLLPSDQKRGTAEDALFSTQIEDLKEWWRSPRFSGIKRPYTPEDVISKRGSLQQTYPSSLMARKLFRLLEERAEAGQPVHTSKDCRGSV